MAGVSDRIKLQRYKESAQIHSPLKNFDIDTHDIEIRLDPLTGNKSIVGLRIVEKYDTLIESTNNEFIESLVSESDGKCFFCPEKVSSSTPKFLEDILPEGRISAGEAILFPNLFPLSKYHAIIVPCKKHFLRPDEFSPTLVSDAFLATQRFVSSLPSDEHLYGSINSNYMPPAGASAIHPHMQLTVSSQQFNYSKMINEAVTKYKEKNGHDYWEDIIEIEMKLGERYVGKTGLIHWVTPFSPSCTNEVWGVLPVGRFVDISENDIDSLGQGVSNVLRYYGTNGFSSFNFSMDLGNIFEQSPSSRCFIRLVTRQNVSPGYRAGEHFFQHLLDTEVVVIPPEIVAEKLRGVFVGA
jgi:UDPglucose--hexose-1-phosphate uridylyltransferase